MRCLNDALDEATASQRAPCGGKALMYTSLAGDTPPWVEIPADLVVRSAVRCSSSRISAVFIGCSATMCGFTDGRAVLTRCFDDDMKRSDTQDDILNDDGFVVAEIPPFAPENGLVVALGCVPFTEVQWAVAIGYTDVVYVTLVDVKRSSCFFLTQKKRVQPRVIEVSAAAWAPGGQVSSLQLSPCLGYLAIAFNGDAFVTLARLPSLELPHGERDAAQNGRFSLPISWCVVKDGGLTDGRQGHAFFLPEKAPWNSPSVFTAVSSASTTAPAAEAVSAASEELRKQRHPFCLLMWVGSSNYTRCPLNTINASAVKRLKTLMDPQPKEQDAFVSALQRRRSKLDGNNFDKKRLSSAAERTAAKTLRAKQPLFSGVYRGLLPGRIIAVATASADGGVVAAMCDGGLVYLVDGHGITSVISSTPTLPHTETLRATGLCSAAAGVRRKAPLRAVTVTLEAGTCHTLAHIRGIPAAAFTKWATVHFLQEVEGLRAVLSLGELPHVLVFCNHGVYLWDVHYNSVVAVINGLPPLEPFEIHGVAPLEAAGGGAQLLRGATPKMGHKKHVYLPFCTESAIFWRSTGGVMIRIRIHDLLACVYPLVHSYFPSLHMHMLAWLLERVPPPQRHVRDCIASTELPIEQQLLAHDNASVVINTAAAGDGVGRGWPSASTAPHPQILRTLAALRRPDAAAADFLMATCSSTYTRITELSNMFDLSRAQRS